MNIGNSKIEFGAYRNTMFKDLIDLDERYVKWLLSENILTDEPTITYLKNELANYKPTKKSPKTTKATKATKTTKAPKTTKARKPRKPKEIIKNDDTVNAPDTDECDTVYNNSVELIGFFV